MGDSYSAIYVHAVFAVKYRKSLIHQSWEKRLYKFIRQLLESKRVTVLEINGVADHIHLLVRIRNTHNMSDLMNIAKGASSRWIGEEGFCDSEFVWQKGFGTFSVSVENIPKIRQYVKNQKHHHKVDSFVDEYQRLLKEANIDFHVAGLLKAPI